MYETFYHLSAKPFSLLPDADFLFLGKRHKRALNLLDYGLETQAGFVVISGEIGAGKTTVVRRFLKNVGKNIIIGNITNPSAHFGRLLGWIASAFDLKISDSKRSQASDSELYNLFVEFLLASYAKGKRVILIIDEAQNLSAPMLEELRMLSNVNNERDLLLQIVLVGQPELLETLKKPELRQFVQRIAVHCHLDPLNAPETAAYIRHRLKLVGGSPDLFDDTSCAAVYYFSGGVPRLINLLCDQALVYGYSEDRPTVSFETVAEVVADHSRFGLSAFRSVPAEWLPFRLKIEFQPALDEIRRARQEGGAA